MPKQFGGPGRRGRDGRPRNQMDSTAPDTIEKVVKINHVAKVVKGGRRFGFSTIVVVGDGKSKVGVSIGKAKEVPESITKGRSGATKGMKPVKVVNGTIPHPVVGRCGASRVLLRPAVPGTGIIAGAPVRAIMEASGIRDVIAKTIGSSNAVNVVKATMDGLNHLRLPEEISELRGKPVAELFIAKRSRRMVRSDEDQASDRPEGEGMESGFPADSGKRRDSGRPPRGPGAPQQGSFKPRPAGKPRDDRGGRGGPSRPPKPQPDRRPRASRPADETEPQPS